MSRLITNVIPRFVNQVILILRNIKSPMTYYFEQWYILLATFTLKLIILIYLEILLCIFSTFSRPRKDSNMLHPSTLMYTFQDNSRITTKYAFNKYAFTKYAFNKYAFTKYAFPSIYSLKDHNETDTWGSEYLDQQVVGK